MELVKSSQVVLVFSIMFQIASGNSSALPSDHYHKKTVKRVTTHPLDPLRPSEIVMTRNIIFELLPSYGIEGPIHFNYITLVEPPKSVLQPYFLSNEDEIPLTGLFPRRSYTLLLDTRSAKSYEVVVNLDSILIERFNQSPEGVMLSFLDVENIIKIENEVLSDPQVQERCATLGFANRSLITADIWPFGPSFDFEKKYSGYKAGSLMQAFLYGKKFTGDNYQAHPFDFIVIYSALQHRVVAIEDLPIDDQGRTGSHYDPETLVPQESTNFDPEVRSHDSFRADDKPIIVDSPEGTSYEVHGQKIHWQNFNFRLGFNGREGVVLHMVKYNDSGNIRPILYRASSSEMYVPYADPRPPYYRKGAYDEGEFGLGISATSLIPFADCAGRATYFDAVLNNDTGHPIVYKKAICLTEEDDGILWRARDKNTHKAITVRSHRLLLSFTATVGNYDYVFKWVFYQDGSIQHQVQMTGMLSINIIAEDATPAGFGTIVFPQINAQYHQHFFNVRLDFDIDGGANSVHMIDIESAGPTEKECNKNPYGSGITTKTTPLKTSSQARTFFSAETGRTWVVTNSKSVNTKNNLPVGYKLIPQNTPGLLMKKDSLLRPKAAFLDYDVWVTPFKDEQMFAGGQYLNNSGLPEWVAKDPNANIQDEDIVLWHNFGMTHFPRVEDFPVMPVEIVGFWLKPFNFFSENPALSVPPSGTHKKQEL